MLGGRSQDRSQPMSKRIRIEPRFVSLPAHEALERARRLRALLLTGALRNIETNHEDTCEPLAL